MGARSTANVYAPASGDITVKGATAISEFFGFVGDCGEAASEILYSWSQGKAPSGTHINAVVSALQHAGLAGNQGVSTLSEESKGLSREGVPNYATSNWLGALQQNIVNATASTVHPVELLVNAPNLGANLPGDEFGVHGHFIAVEGWSPTHNAFIVSDPDNSAAKAGRLVFYTPGQIASANPQGAIVASGAGQGIAGGGPGGGIGTAAGSITGAASGVGDVVGNAVGGTLGSLWPTIQADIAKAGFLAFAALIMLVGLVLLVAPAAANTTQQVVKYVPAA